MGRTLLKVREDYIRNKVLLPGQFFDSLVECFIEDEDEEMNQVIAQELDRVIDFILADGYDISDFELDEVPTPGVYCFFSTSNGKAFNIYARDGTEVTAGYFSNGGEVYTSNIETAVQGASLSRESDIQALEALYGPRLSWI